MSGPCRTGSIAAAWWSRRTQASRSATPLAMLIAARRLADGPGRIKTIRAAVAASNIEFRAEFFNLFNRTNFRAPTGNSVNRSNAAFGTITATYDPRIIQFGVKFNF